MTEYYTAEERARMTPSELLARWHVVQWNDWYFVENVTVGYCVRLYASPSKAAEAAAQFMLCGLEAGCELPAFRVRPAEKREVRIWLEKAAKAEERLHDAE